jgi:hypothetical protein
MNEQHEEIKHTPWQPHRYEQRGNCDCESCTKMKLSSAQAATAALRDKIMAVKEAVRKYLEDESWDVGFRQVASEVDSILTDNK